MQLHHYFLCGLMLFVVPTHQTFSCHRVDTINRSLRDYYCDQPLFVNFLENTEENRLLDNVCMTMFPLPDDPDTFQVYTARVYCDGSLEVVSTINTDIESGLVRFANPFTTQDVGTVGYAGCDTYIINMCVLYGGGRNQVYGLSSNCRAIGLSCLRKVEEILEDKCLYGGEFYVLPMKLPNRCVTQQLCLQPPGNEFYKAVGLAGPIGVF